MIEQEHAREGDVNSMTVLNQEFEQNKLVVIDMLIENCMNVDISIPRVVRGKFGEDQ